VSLESDTTFNPDYYQREQIWSKYGQIIDRHYKLTTNHCSFCKQEDHSLTNYPFIEQNVRDAMIHHFHIQTQNHQNPKNDHNLLAIPQNMVTATQL
jgi:hypothetical protein